MYYVRYFFKCVIRKIVNLIFKPKYFLTFLVIGILISILFCNTTFASTGEGDVVVPTILTDLTLDTNTDKIVSFGGFNLYYIKVSEGQNISYQFTTDVNCEVIYGFTRELPKLGVDVYSVYSETLEEGYITSERFRTFSENGYFCIAVYPKNGFNTIVFRDYTTNADALNNLGNTLSDNQDKNTDKIIESQEQIKDSLTNSDVSDDSMKVNTNGLGLGDEQGVNQFFSNMLNTVRNTFLGINNTVETIEIPIPFTDDDLVLSSDLVSKHIQGTTIYVLIQGLWWFVIGKYIVMFSYRMIAWLSTGKIADKGISSFIDYLDKNNEIINSYMM